MPDDTRARQGSDGSLHVGLPENVVPVDDGHEQSQSKAASHWQHHFCLVPAAHDPQAHLLHQEVRHCERNFSAQGPSRVWKVEACVVHTQRVKKPVAECDMAASSPL